MKAPRRTRGGGPALATLVAAGGQPPAQVFSLIYVDRVFFNIRSIQTFKHTSTKNKALSSTH